MGCYDMLPRGSQIKCWDCLFNSVTEGSEVPILAQSEHVIILKEGGYVKVSSKGKVLKIVEDGKSRKVSDFPGIPCFDKWGNPWQDETYEVDGAGYTYKGVAKN